MRGHAAEAPSAANNFRRAKATKCPSRARQALIKLFVTKQLERINAFEPKRKPALCPGELIFRKSSARIVRRNPIRNVRPPFPKYEIVHVLASALGEGRHQYAGSRLAQSIRDAPGRWLAPIGKIEFPGAGHVDRFNAGSATAIASSKINDILDIDIVAHHGTVSIVAPR